MAATTVLSVPEAPTISISALSPDFELARPTSISMFCELPVKVITALISSQPEVAPALSQLKSISLLLPVKLNTPVKLSPSISKVIRLELPTWSILKFVAEPLAVDAVVLLPTLLPSPSCNTSNTNEAPACVT